MANNNTETKVYWAIVKDVHPVTQENIYVMGDKEPALFDRQKDASRWKAHLGLPKRCKIIEVCKDEDGKLQLYYPGM